MKSRNINLRLSLAPVPIYLQIATILEPLGRRAVAGPMSSLFGQIFRRLRTQNPGRSLPSLLDRLLPLLQSKIPLVEHGNYDAERWGWDGRDRSWRIAMGMSWRQLSLLFDREADFEKAWALLGDDDSRRWMEDLLAYRILGHQHVRLPTNTDEYWSLREQAKAMEHERTHLERPPTFGLLERFTVEFEGQKLKVDCSWPGIAWTFLLRQYYFDRNGVAIRPEKGDWIIDAGSGLGDTALAFSAVVGKAGKVFSFDIGENAIVRENLALNPALAERIVFVPRPLGDTTSGADAGGSLPGLTSIDEYVESNGIERVDLIKMDIEGAELSALKGAVRTIRRFKPKLAISAYHRDDDLISLPLWIDSLGLGYRLYLDHYTTQYEETVLYATAR